MVEEAKNNDVMFEHSDDITETQVANEDSLELVISV